jgi:hypothetical protein
MTNCCSDGPVGQSPERTSTRGSGYPSFPKIPRFNREVIVTEKLDGTNALIRVWPLWFGAARPTAPSIEVNANACDDPEFVVAAGSRNRWLTPEADNYGFARWVFDHAEELVTLGPGLHYGEWYGQGIQRGYGLTEKRFALFNTDRWNADNVPSCCGVVPVLRRGSAASIEAIVGDALEELTELGSAAVPGFMRPEGVVIYHSAARQPFKVLLEGDERPKGLAG